MRPGGKVLIIGGGIGGLVLARALARAGIECEIFEREPEFREAGAGLLLQTGALQALRSLGLEGQVTRVGKEMAAGIGRTADGRIRNRTEFAFLRHEFGAAIVAIHRARLQQALLDGLTVPLHTGRALTSYEADDDGVVARFSDGSSAAGALLVGADGLRSRVRSILLSETPLRYAGYSSYRGVAANVAGVASDELSESWGRGTRFGVVPIGHGEAYWFAVFNAREGEQSADPKALLEPLFGGYAAPIPSVIAATPVERLIRTDIHDRPPVASWSRGRVTLLGDAAHPTTPNLGQGACMAIEDAVVLAHQLERAADLRTALAAYEAVRVPHCSRIVKASFQFGRAGRLDGALSTWLRNVALRSTPSSVIEKQMRENARFVLEPR